MNISLHFLVITFLVLLIVIFLLILAVLMYGFYGYRSNLQRKAWSDIIGEQVVSAIVSGEVFTDEVVNKLNRKKKFRNLFLQKLVSAEGKFSGIAGDVVRNVFAAYKLENEAFAKLKSKRVFLIAGGIQELTAMRSEKSLAEISKFLNHPSPMVYQEAQYSQVTINGFEGLRFLDSAKELLSEWQQLRLLNSIPSVPPGAEVVVEKWLHSENSSIVIFSLRLIRKFQLLAIYPELLPLLNHDSVEVRIQAVQTIQALENSSTLYHLESQFDQQPQEVQVEIIKALKKMGDVRSKNFLFEELKNHPDSAVRIEASEALFSLGLEEELSELMTHLQDSDELYLIIKHALQKKE